MSKIKPIQVRLSALNFLEFGVWGAYLISLGNFLGRVGLETHIGWFYAVQGIVSLFMPAVVGIIADRWIQAQRMLSLCHLLAGAFMAAAGIYALTASQVEFAPLFALYTCSVAFFMPTIGLANSVAFNALGRAGLDTITYFPPIRVFGTVGFICSMLFVNFTQFQTNAYQLITSAVLSFALAAYSLTMPSCPTNPASSGSVVDSLGLRAFKLFKVKKMAIFFIFSMCLGVSLQITNSYGNIFITSFSDLAEYADTWGARNANALISISQMSETLCILLIPFCLKRFGIKGVMLMSMFAWVFRFGFFGLGDTGSGLWMLVISCIVYGIAFDFFNVSGGLYVDKQTDKDLRSSAQGLFMIMTNGIGATIGTLAAQALVNHFVFSQSTPEAQHAGWTTSWFIFAAYALVVAILFIFIFKDDHTPDAKEARRLIEETESQADGFAGNPDTK
ncbi:MAG: MFS transporter [Duncaniella sp.]|nr:MFS transporter [Duncaniella sp.]MDE6359582.1 MFS transporter [Duncaniella sp.]